MKTVLLCHFPYDFSILKPLADELARRGYDYLWYVPPALFGSFPYKLMVHTNSLELVQEFNPEIVFVSGEDVPLGLKGLKVCVFHSLAGEKEEYFTTQNHIHLYLTAGPYFTEPFEELMQENEQCEVVETGWCKLDAFYVPDEAINETKVQLLQEYGAKHMVLYAPTSTPELTSAVILREMIKKLSDQEDVLVLIKFHDEMDTAVIDAYKEMEHPSIRIVEERDIIPSMLMADLLISDTSSVVYEFMLLEKPVITFNSYSENINWSNHSAPQEIYLKVIRTLKGSDTHVRQREKTIALYHPYRDGLASSRMVDAVEKYIADHGIPEDLEPLSWMQRWKLTLKKYF